jgi:taurine dioxygenase
MSSRASHAVEANRLSGALGAELSGIDLAMPLDQIGANAIRAALLEHLVIFFRDQNLSSEQFLRFARAMGEPQHYPLLQGLADYPEITEVKKLEHERVNFGGIWHSDTTYLERPPMGSMLYAQEVPPFGGDTLFANQYLAFETLSPGMQRMLDGLIAISSSAKADATKTREDRVRTQARSDAKSEYLAEHPVVRTHPETGRKALYVNVAHTVRFKDMTEEESAPLLAYLFQHQVCPEFTCRFRWRVGSLAFWDNRCVQHNPVNDYHGHRRLMHRITLAGDVPR